MAQTQIGSADPVALAAELHPLLARNAAQAERDRRLPAENIQILEARNLFKVMVPRRWGGYGAPLPTVLNTFAELARGCGSTGWVAMILNGCGWWASLLPDRGQEEVFAHADSRFCAAGSPVLKGLRVPGGVQISGKFPFASGCWHSSWGGLNVQVEDQDQNASDVIVAFAPISELEIEDTWFVAGMCGTGSNTLVARDVFVPDYRILWMGKLLNGALADRGHTGEASDRYWFYSANALITIAPVIGIAQAILECVIDGTSKRGITFTTYTRQADSSVVQHQIAEAAVKIESASLLIMRAAQEVEDSAVAGTSMDYVTRARIRGVVGFAARLLREAVDPLMSIGGTSGFADSSPLQRLWRDASIATRHVLLATDPSLEIYGRALLGVEGNITPII
jgi:3-hydroxy-9,10-secoandrosta-1,3,5(10)-triene-9,17-dione monooxygenase